MFKLGFITDEVSQDPEEIVNFAKRHGVKYLELRSVSGKNIRDFSESEIIGLNEFFKNNGTEVVSVSSPVFKCDMSNEEEVAEHIRDFEKIAGFCNIFGARYVRGFDFWKNCSGVPERKEKFAPILKICEKYGITYLLEYDPSVNSSDAKKVRELVDLVGSEYFCALYDAGNALWSDPEAVPYPDDYETLKGKFRHIHIKDAVIIDKKAHAVKVGTGKVDYKGLFERLRKDGYSGCVMLETHYRLKSEISDKLMSRPGGYEFSDGALSASEESMTALKKITDSVRE